MAADLPTDWLTAESIVTLTGAAAAVVSIANTTWKLFGLKPLAVGIISSIVIVVYGGYRSGTLATVEGGLIALVNICILFSLAFGIDETLNTFAKRDSTTSSSAFTDDSSTPGRRQWLRSW